MGHFVLCWGWLHASSMKRATRRACTTPFAPLPLVHGSPLQGSGPRTAVPPSNSLLRCVGVLLMVHQVNEGQQRQVVTWAGAQQRLVGRLLMPAAALAAPP